MGMAKLTPSNQLSKIINSMYLSIESYDSALDEFSFTTTCFLVMRLNNNIDNLISSPNSTKLLEYLSFIVREFFNNHTDIFLEFRDDFLTQPKTNDPELDNFIITSSILKPALQLSDKALIELRGMVAEDSLYKVNGLLLVNLFFVMAVNFYHINFKFFIPIAIKFINEYCWILAHSKDSKLSEDYYTDFLSNNTPIQRHTAPRKVEALNLAKKIWSYDKDKILLRKQVAKMITKLLPQHDLSINQVDNWLKQSDLVPKEILERYKNNDYCNTKSEKRKREILKIKIFAELDNINYEDM